LNGLGIVAALVAESRPLGPATRRGTEPTNLADGTLLIVSGVGLAAAACGARRLLAAGARALLSWGLAGGLDPALEAGALVLPLEVISPEGRVLRTSADWRERVDHAIAARQAASCGRLLTCREPLTSTTAKALAFQRTGAVAVDMESSAVAEVAAAERVPFLTVRAIVDTARDAVPEVALNAAAAGQEGPNIGRVLIGLAGAPGQLPGLIRLARRYRIASRALAAVAASGALASPVWSEAKGGAIP
jgi:adenosylhomocysteine nucleosidase